MHRRNFLKILPAGILASCATTEPIEPTKPPTPKPEPKPEPPKPEPKPEPVNPNHALIRRASFGYANPDADFAVWVNDQLSMPITPDKDVFKIPIQDVDPSQFDNLRRVVQQSTLHQFADAETQLHERMVDFWGNFFSIDSRGGKADSLHTLDQQQKIRKLALGNFRDLLYAMETSPAMLQYLDNTGNNYTGEVGGNENLGRELLELHTLGEGNYTQDDVVGASQVLSGWGINGFNSDKHHTANKYVRGNLYEPGAYALKRLTSNLSRSVETAFNVATRLSLYFTGSSPSSLVDKVAAAFVFSRQDIKKTLEILLLSDEFANAKKFKSHVQFIISDTRENSKPTDIDTMYAQTKLFSQNIHACPTPDGHPDNTDRYKTVKTLQLRWDFATNTSEEFNYA